MPRTSWQDLLDDTPSGRTDGDVARAEAGAAVRELSPSLAGAATGAGAAAGGGLPQSLEEIPELRELMAERSRLERTLRQLTGQEGPPRDEREARRFPMETGASEDGMTLSDFDEQRARRRARPIEVERPERAEGDDARVERARLRRQAATQRVARAQEEWTQHRESLLAARDRLRETARVGRLLPEPGRDVLERATRIADGVGDLLDRVDHLRERLGGGGDPGGEDPSAWTRLRDSAREARRFLEDPLASADVGRSLNRLREELAPPELRPLADRTREGDVDLMELRRLRALEALRERRAEDSPRPSRSAADPRVD